MRRLTAQGFFALMILSGAVRAIAAPSPIVIATGPVSSFAYPLGGEICRLFEQEAQDKARCLVSASDGSVDNIKRLRAGEIALAIVQSDVAADAVSGGGVFAGTPPFADLRSLTGFYSEAFTVLVRGDGQIKQPEDLKGKRIAVGEKGAPEPLFADFLEGLGWSKTDLGGVIEMPRTDQIAALCGGKIAAIVVTAPHPNGFVREALTACPTVALDLGGAVTDSVLAAHPTYGPAHLDMSIYGGATYSVQSFGPRAVLVTLAKLDSDIAARVLSGLFKHLDMMKKAHPAFAALDQAALASGQGLGAERHAAAVKYLADHKIGDPGNGE